MQTTLLILILLSLGPLSRLFSKRFNNFEVALACILSYLLFLFFVLALSNAAIHIKAILIHFLVLVAYILSSPVLFIKSPTLEFFNNFNPNQIVSERELLDFFEGTKMKSEFEELKSAGLISQDGDSLTNFGQIVRMILKLFILEARA